MWQRIQTLYLAISTILIASLLMCNVANTIGPDGAVEHIRYYEKLPYLIFIFMIISGNGFTLFSYKSRIMQMRLAIMEALIMAGFQIWLLVDYLRFIKDPELVFSFTAIFPLIAAIFNVMAARRIALDEAMVQSAYRLRKSHRK